MKIKLYLSLWILYCAGCTSLGNVPENGPSLSSINFTDALQIIINEQNPYGFIVLCD